MSKFKVGDSVRYTGTHYAAYTHLINQCGQVVKEGHRYSNDGVFVKFDNGDTLFCADVNLEPVIITKPPAQQPPCEGKTGVEWSKWIDSPVGTKRYIKPGTYGIVEVIPTTVGEFKYRLEPYATAEQLREAAHVLNQIAEVLEENAS